MDFSKISRDRPTPGGSLGQKKGVYYIYFSQFISFY